MCNLFDQITFKFYSMKSHCQKLIISLLIIICIGPVSKIYSQSNPVALKPAIQIERLMTVPNGIVRMVYDPVLGMMLYSTTGGNIYAVIQPDSTPAYDSLIYSVSDHSLEYLQGMVVNDSTLYISGNNSSNTLLTTGLIIRGKIQTNGLRSWDTLMITDPYETGDYFDHLFSGLAISPSGDSLYICSGARGDHGEIQDRYGAYPGLRNVPLTANLYALPTNSPSAILLQNDSAWNDTSQYLFARGIRNTFSMAFDASGNLFGVENSGDRDHNEEMNWLQRGMHYGFPWKMGDTYNPQQYPAFDPNTDPLIPHYSRSWRNGFWNNDPGFPSPPSGITFQDPIQNIGPDCDKFRDTITGTVKDASDLAISIGTFTAHRSPLGLVFDNAMTLHPAYRGDAFMLSWTHGLDSCGCTAIPDTGIGPFVDPSEDLVHLDLSFDSTTNNFQLSATRIVADFSHPIDALVDSNSIYVVENGYGGTSGLYRITLPIEQACTPSVIVNYADSCSSAPVSAIASSSGTPPFNFEWKDGSGVSLQISSGLYTPDTLNGLSPGTYKVIISDSTLCADSIQFIVRQEIDLQIGIISGTSCIGCDDGVIRFTTTGAIAPLTFSVTPPAGVFYADSLTDLPPGTYLICVSDSNTCAACDTATILEDPSEIDATEFALSKMNVFPNPAKGTVSISYSYSNSEIPKIRILDLLGKEVPISILDISRTKDLTIVNLSLEGIRTGNYIIELRHKQLIHIEKLSIHD